MRDADRRAYLFVFRRHVPHINNHRIAVKGDARVRETLVELHDAAHVEYELTRRLQDGWRQDAPVGQADLIEHLELR